MLALGHNDCACYESFLMVDSEGKSSFLVWEMTTSILLFLLWLLVPRHGVGPHAQEDAFPKRRPS